MAIETWENFFKFIVFPDETTFYLAISPVPIIVNIDPMVSKPHRIQEIRSQY
jgi:hypothetical protein